MSEGSGEVKKKSALIIYITGKIFLKEHQHERSITLVSSSSETIELNLLVKFTNSAHDGLLLFDLMEP